MKCYSCGKEHTNVNCSMREENKSLCINCCKSLHSWDLCKTTCEKFPKERSNAPLIKGLELTRVYDGHTHKFVEDMFIPNIFTQLYCDVSLCQINIFEPNNIEVDLIFQIKEFTRVRGKVSIKEAYLKDEWKISENGENLKGLVPILQVYTFENGNSNISANSFSVDNHPFMKNNITSYHYRTWQPFSKAIEDYINVKEMKEFKEDTIRGRVVEGEVFFGKNDTIWAELLLNKDYKFTLDITYSNLTINRKNQQVKIPFGLYFPFKLVNYYDYSITVSNDLNIEEESKYFLITPKKTKDEQIFLTPLEENMSLISGGYYCKNEIEKEEKTFHYDRNCIFLHDLALKVDTGFVVNSKKSNYPLMTGLYKSMKRLYNGKFAPCYVSLINSSDKIRKVSIMAQIQDISKKNQLHINLRPYEYRNVPILPILKYDKIKKISEITTKGLDISIYEEKKRIYSETHEIIVHPIESFIYNFQDKGYASKTYLYQLLACYCTPHIREIESVISKASTKVGNILGALSNDYLRIMQELESIYNVLSEGMTYVTRSFTFSLENLNETQRVSLPSNTMRLKSGNCIDLSLLLASAYESCKHEVELILVPGHALLAVKVTGIWMYIEATCLGNKEFKEATNLGWKQYEKHFDSNGQARDSNSRRISLKLARENEILPFE